MPYFMQCNDALVARVRPDFWPVHASNYGITTLFELKNYLQLNTYNLAYSLYLRSQDINRRKP
jgi:hypothetical protein